MSEQVINIPIKEGKKENVYRCRGKSRIKQKSKYWEGHGRELEET